MDKLYAFCFWLLMVLTPAGLLAQAPAVLSGTVVDSLSGQALPYATLRIVGTPLGARTDAEGQFRLVNVPPGEQVLEVAYLGYRSWQVNITLAPGERRELRIPLAEAVFSTGEVTISAQIEGQRAAINQQINANTIVNVVSRDRIQELPDQNAAETVGRLPGVSVQRENGEGTKVTLRGLSPRYNAVTINGERIPSTDAADRSVDLSMVSTDALEGIEVFKALTPDKDGDAVGGAVNFITKRAASGYHGFFRLESGYNAQAREFGQWRGNFSLSNRFWNDRLGIILAGNYQRANRSSDQLDSDWFFAGERADGSAIIAVNNLNLTDRYEIRNRYGGSLTLDLRLPKGGIMLNSFLGSVDRDELVWRRRYRTGTFRQEYDFRDQQQRTLTQVNTLQGDHILPLKLELSWRASASLSQRRLPYSHTLRFREDQAFVGSVDESTLEGVVAGAKNRLDATYMQESQLNDEAILDLNYTTQVDLKRAFAWGRWLRGYVKVGAKVRTQDRTRDLSRLWTGPGTGPLVDIAVDHPEQFLTNANDRILMTPFYTGPAPADFLAGRYALDFGPTLDMDALNAFAAAYAADYYTDDGRAVLENYTAGEVIRAGYAMYQLDFWEKLTLLGGVRRERTLTDYRGRYGRPFERDNGLVVVARDTTGGQDYREWLPMFHLKYQAVKWADLRLAVTKTLARPNFFDLVPWQRINDVEQTVERGEASLQHTTIWNYDAFLSFYPQIGLFTVGGFYKELENVDYQRVTRDREQGPTTGYQLTVPENSPFTVRVWGVEVDAQTNLRFLPKPLDGIVIAANATLIRSETFFPFLIVGNSGPPFFLPVVTDTVRSGPLPDQPGRVFNVSLGYEKKWFSGRVSMVHQGGSLSFLGNRAELDGFNRFFTRWDASLQIKASKALRFYLNANNLSNTPERSFLGDPTRPLREEYFGWTADVGVRYQF